MTTTAEHDRDRLVRRARLLAWLTIAWNVVEAVVAIGAGLGAGSLALVGFGVDSSIETLAAVVVLWRLAGGHEEREERALRLVALSFFLLAGWVGVQSVVDLVTRSRPEASSAGVAITGLSLVVMPLLAAAKRRVGGALDSRTVLADAAETLLCAYLSAAVLLGLLANAVLGWWWGDPLAALVVAWLALREGREAWEGEDDD